MTDPTESLDVDPIGADPGRDRTDGRSLYLDVSGTPAYAVLHSPDADADLSDTAVLLCPPFGYDEVCAYRILREWAIRLARAGHPTLRLTYPSCGDSGGAPRDPDRLEAWTESVSVAATTLREHTGVSSVIALGLGLGGLLAYRAVSVGAAIDGLVLWAAPPSGRDFIRRLKALSRLESSEFFKGLPDPPPPPDGELEAGGFLLAAQTVTDITAVDVATLELPNGLPRGALLLELDGIAIDDRLRDPLERRGVEVTTAAGDGYAALTSQPHESIVPEQVLATVAQWLDASSAPPPVSARYDGEPHVAGRSAEVEIETDGAGVVHERAVTIEIDGLQLSGVLTIPVRPAPGRPGAIFLHSGAIRRIGPNRMWVEAARDWAMRGIASLRLDVEGIGDSDGAVAPYAEDPPLYEPQFLQQVTAGIDFMSDAGVAERVAIIGLCAGAYWALRAAVADARVAACLLVNPRAFVYYDGMDAARDMRRALAEPLTVQRIRQNVTRARVTKALQLVAAFPARQLARFRSGPPAFDYGTELDALLARVRDSGSAVTLVFTAREPLDEELTRFRQLDRMAAWPSFTLSRVAVRDHTLRPIWAQQQALSILGRSMSDRFELDPAATR
jgi:alpha-beta hydrolase superfamily lysophospholipase